MSEKINMNDDWKFFLGDLPPHSNTEGWGGAKAGGFSFGATARTLNDTRWRTVNLPHDFVSEGLYSQKANTGINMTDIPEMESMDSRHGAGGYLEGGIAWYRKKFSANGLGNKRVYIHFDGIYRNSTIYLNHYIIGIHEGGYDSFYYDITDFLEFENENILAVRVDSNGREGWWYEGGGIYRNVYLEVAENIAVSPYGIRVIATPSLVDKTAEIDIDVEILNKNIRDVEFTVKSSILDENDNIVAEVFTNGKAALYESTIVSAHVNLNNCILWDIERPYLYKVKTEIFENDILCDTTLTEFGIREMKFDAENGFYLNGNHVKIKGLCCHQDHAGVGIAEDESIMEYRLMQMKSMGMNAYRSAHSMPVGIAKLCDKLGILLFAETRRMSTCDNDLKALRMLVKMCRNSPSVFLWGIGNEEVFVQDTPQALRQTITMRTEVRKLDPTRPVTSAVVCWNGVERFNNARSYEYVTKELDVMGFNYCQTAWEDYHERMPHQPIIVTENSSNSGTRGCYSTDESLGLYCINDPENKEKCKSGQKAVRKNVAEESWAYIAERDYISGVFIWTGMDYRGEPTPLKWPGVYSQFGIFDYCGFPKDNYYYYKSWWQEDDVLHISPHWNLDCEYTDVYVYSNFEEIELFVNKKSIGKKAMHKNMYLIWKNVKYEPGEVSAIGYRNGVEIKIKYVKTTGVPYKLEAELYKKSIKTNETAIINVKIMDTNGNVVPTADNLIKFEINGGTLLGTGNGNPGDHDSEKVPQRRAFGGMCQVLVKSMKEKIMEISIKSARLKPCRCQIKVK